MHWSLLTDPGGHGQCITVYTKILCATAIDNNQKASNKQIRIISEGLWRLEWWCWKFSFDLLFKIYSNRKELF